jgi:hypothetical protein
MGRGRRLHTGHPYRYVRGRRVYAPGVRHGVPGRAATGAAPGAIRRKGVAIHPRTGMAIHPQTGVPIRYGQVVGGQCQCAPCPSCGTVTAPVAAVPAPAYCRCCGQVIR